VEESCLPVASDDLEVTVVSPERNVESYDSLACLDQVEPLGIDAGLGSTRLEEELHLFEESGFAVGIEA
jgi:hypothetical protein